MQNWTELYLELSEKISEIEAIKWIDLWHNQISFLDTEHPFPTPAVFFNFRIPLTEDAGEKAQKAKLQTEVYVFYETFADTFKGSYNQESALAFLGLVTEVYAKLHGTGGNSYSSMRRLTMNPVDTGNSGNLYQIVFECILMDYSASKAYEQVTIPENINVQKHIPTPPVEGDAPEPLFRIR
jgi:hypothetical protein